MAKSASDARFSFNKIPKELRDQDRWVPVIGQWERVKSDTLQARRKLKKTPIRTDGSNASPNDPSHWWPFKEAVKKVKELQADGPAFLFFVINPEDGYVYGDLDGSVKDTLEIHADAREWCDAFTYVETSPSGTGLRWIAKGSYPRNAEAPDHRKAIHVTGYISLTGAQLENKDRITEQQDVIDKFAQHCKPSSNEKTPLPEFTADPPPVNTDDLSLSEDARALLEDLVVPPSGVRSDVVQSVANALAGDLGFGPSEVYAVLTHHPGTRQVAVERRNGRTHAANEWLWSVALASARARGNYVGDWSPTARRSQFSSPQPVGDVLFNGHKPEPPEVLIHGLIPCDVFGWVGAGGSAKTTLMLWTMIHVILGMPIANHEVKHAGPTLFLTAEDDAQLVRYRLRELCDSLGLNEEQRRTIGRHLYVEDITGRLIRFVETDRSNNMLMTKAVDQLIDVYRPVAPVLVAADPAVYFGPGERYVNDAEAALMAVGRHIGRELGTQNRRAAFGWIHHVSQVVAREGIVDQYASRGGTAFADNSRAQIVFTRHADDNPRFPIPTAVTHSDVEEGRVLRMHVAKFSYGVAADQPLWVVRGTGSQSFHFNVTNGVSPRSPEAEAIRAAEKNRQLIEDAQSVWDFLKQELEGKAYHTKTSVREQCERLGLSSRRATAAVSYLMARALVVETPLPSTVRHGGRQGYLDPQVRPELSG